MLAALLVALSLDPQGGAAAQTASAPPDLTLVVAAPVYQPDGASLVETTAVTDGTEFIFGRRSLCEPVTASAKEPADAGYGWQLTSRTIRRSPTELVVSIDWRRRWDGGQKIANGPSGSVELTLHPGDRIPLDHIPGPAGSVLCRAVGMGLEVRVARAAPLAPLAQSALPLGSTEGGTGMLDADMWLVHKRPSGTEEVLYQRVRLPPMGAPFGFTPVTFPTAAGDVGVAISGSIRRLRGPGGVEQLIVSMMRVVTSAATPPGGIGGSTSKMITLPAPSDVTAFEMPAPGARGAGGGGRGGYGGGAGGGTGGAVLTGGGGGLAQGQAASGGGGRSVAAGAAGGRGGAARGAVAVPVSGILDGHVFSIRLQLTPAGI